MRPLFIASCFALPFALGGCGVEPSVAAGASLNAKPVPKSEPVKTIAPVDPAILQQAPTPGLTLDRDGGEIRFRDGQHRERLPSGAPDVSRSYRAGEGTTGGVKQRAVSAEDFSAVAPATPGVIVHRVNVKETSSTDDDAEQ
jgi:hypothetical protein